MNALGEALSQARPGRLEVRADGLDPSIENSVGAPDATKMQRERAKAQSRTARRPEKSNKIKRIKCAPVAQSG